MVTEARTIGMALVACAGLVGTCCADGAGGTGRDRDPGSPETCNGIDDDGDGLVDEGPSGYGAMTEPCTTACGPGTRICLGGSWSECSAPEPGPDGCPCTDGEVRECSTECGTGIETCAAGAFAGCTAPVPEPEECGNSLDDDCDGLTDEGCGDCTPGETRSCGTDRGECVSGTRTCRADSTWGACSGNVGPREETCDGLDNDCDGEVDEDLAGDPFEANDTCEMARRIPDVLEAVPGSSFVATISPSGDEDWLWVRAVEGWHDCEPLTGQCYYSFTVGLDAPPGSDLDVCLTPAWPSDHPACRLVGEPGMTFCLVPGETTMTLEWEGICMLDDSIDFVIQVRQRPGAVPSCDPYELEFEMGGPEDVCPGGY